MKILYHVPSLHSIYANRTIYHGYQNAFLNLGHEFKLFTAGQNFERVMEEFRPNLFISDTHFWYRKYIDFDILKKFRSEGVFALFKLGFWNLPSGLNRINEAGSLKYDKSVLELMDRDMLGDAYFHVVEQGDERMDGFKSATGFEYHTIPLAADATIYQIQQSPDDRYKSDIAFIGSNLPDRVKFMRQYVYPLAAHYDLKLYGQDWTLLDRTMGWVQRCGQFFNIPGLRGIRKPKLNILDEPKIYRSSKISINFHEEYQKRFGGDCNERTFKIPLHGGFEIVDNISCIRKYYVPDQELVIADSSEDWVEKIHHYMAHPEEMSNIVEAGRRKTLERHTYLHRAKQMLDLMYQSK